MQTTCSQAVTKYSHVLSRIAHKLKFDRSDPVFGSDRGELSCIFALRTGDNVENNLRVNYGLHELVKAWSTDPTFHLLQLTLIEYN